MTSNNLYNHLQSTLQKGKTLYTTGRGTPFTFSKWDKHGSLIFEIPSRTSGKKPNTKAIPKEVLTGSCKPFFTDCRLSVFNKLIENVIS